MNHFDFLANVDVSAAAKELAITSPRWDAMVLRQSFAGSAHKDTKCIPLRGASSFVTSYEVHPKGGRRMTPAAMQLPHTRALMNKVLGSLNISELGNVLAVAFGPGGYIRPHIDEGVYADYFDRFHICITAPKGHWLQCDGEYAFPHAGDVFHFNHRVEHSGGNPSDEWRIHLIFDARLKE